MLLTGDSAVVCRKVCEEINLPVQSIVTTDDLEGASEEKISELAENGTIFAKLTPLQKAQIIRGLTDYLFHMTKLITLLVITTVFIIDILLYI
jgi:magnesium-transporting ATPase (P-type)